MLSKFEYGFEILTWWRHGLKILDHMLVNIVFVETSSHSCLAPKLLFLEFYSAVQTKQINYSVVGM